MIGLSLPFKATLQNRNIASIEVERVQNLAMWQSYVVKLQTICFRETGLTSKAHKKKANGKASEADNTAPLRKALDRFERCWLWHGTNADVKEKILQQGFNRLLCGKNATLYGIGVYFARDASYSSYKNYAVPDAKGYQYMMLACRVVVGEYCHAKQESVTPDLRDAKTQSLYDTTVGLLTNDAPILPFMSSIMILR
jgi:hypothetical protein